MISWAGWWTWIPSATPLQPKKWNAYFWITFNFWWSSRLVDGLKRHPPPLSSQRMKCSFLDYIQLLMISWAGQWTQIPSATPLQTKKWYAHFCITFNFWWLARLANGLKPHLQPLCNQKYEMFVFGLCWTSDDQPGWSMDSNPICNLFPTKKMKCSFLYYVQLLVISLAGQWTQTPSVTPLQPRKWNACFGIMFNFWWSAGLVNGLKAHLPPLFNQKNDMLIFGTRSTSDDWPGWSMDSKPICNPSPTKKMQCSFLDYVQLLMINQSGQRTQTPSATSFQPKKWNAHFCIMFKFWWSAELVDGLEPHLPPLSSQKN